MEIFISWSRPFSNAIAIKLKEFINNVFALPNKTTSLIDVFVSSEDIELGTDWDNRIHKELKNADYGIIVLTKENISSPWINYEAGALEMSFKNKNITPILLDINGESIQTTPLKKYQGIEFSKITITSLMDSINNRLSSSKKISTESLSKKIESNWDILERNMRKIIHDHKINTLPDTKSLPQSNISQIQKPFLKEAILNYNKTIDCILRNKLLLPNDTTGYLNYFLRVINSNRKPEKLKVFARLTLPNVMKKQGGPWPKHLFERYKKAVSDGKISLEYIFCLESTDEKKKYNQYINTYKSFVDNIYIFYVANANIDNEKLKNSIVLFEKHKWVFTHNWDTFYGRMKDSTQWIGEEYYKEYSEIYDQIKSLSEEI